MPMITTCCRASCTSQWLDVYLRALLALALLALASGECPLEWTEIAAGRCFKATRSASFVECATNVCSEEAAGALSTLASVRTEAEANALEKLVANLGGTPAFIGLFEQDPGEDGNDWVWVDGTRTAFVDWKEGRPFQRCLPSEDCAAVLPDSGGWQDVSCTTALPCICELGQNASASFKAAQSSLALGSVDEGCSFFGFTKPTLSPGATKAPTVPKSLPPFFVKEQDEEGRQDSLLSALIALVVIILLLVIAILVLLFALWRKRVLSHSGYGGVNTVEMDSSFGLQENYAQQPLRPTFEV